MNPTAIRTHSAKFFFLLVLLVGGGVSAQAQNVYTIAEGAQIEVSVSPEKGTILLGEPVYVVFEVRNRSDKAFSFFEGGDYRNRLGRPESYRIEAVRKDGKAVPVPRIDFSMGGLGGSFTVDAHGKYQRKLFLPLWAPFEEPGEYRITLRRFMPLQKASGQSNKPDEVEAETTLIVLPPDENKMGNVIAEIGERMFSSDYDVSKDAVYSMTFIKDPRTIPFFVRLLRQAEQSVPQGISDQNVRNAATVLARFIDHEDALAELKAAATSKNDEIRFAVADGLWNGKHPESQALLATMWKDSYWFVRLRVVQGLRGETSEPYRKIIETLTTDKNELVREEAKRALQTNSPQKTD